MTFLAKLEHAKVLLARNRRLSKNALTLEFSLDQPELDLLVHELVSVQNVALLDDQILEWRYPDDVGGTAKEPSGGIDENPITKSEQRAERRQLTVLFCDLVGSSDYARKMDTEDFRDFMREYHLLVSKLIESKGGHVAQFLGDGILAYFGFPQAHEDDAERAIRAGQSILQEIKVYERNNNFDLIKAVSVRVGINTGPVVISEMGASEKLETLAVGEAVNIAARLQSVAKENSITISAETLRLVRGLFLVRDIGEHELKGVGLHRIYEVVRSSGVSNRIDIDPARLTPLVGRDREVGLLLDRWEGVKEAEGETVLVSGDAGLGKSRLLRALQGCLADEEHTWLYCGCRLESCDSNFLPLIELIGRGIGIEVQDDDETKLKRIEAALNITGSVSEEVTPLVASLLSVPMAGKYPPIDMASDVRQRKIIQTLCDWLLALSRKSPIVMVIEDLHWCDKSTLEFITTLIDQIQTVPVFLLLSFRQDFKAPWPARSYILHLEVARLVRQRASDLVKSIDSNRVLPQSMIDLIVERADGVPLFLEELSKMLIEKSAEAGVVGLAALTEEAIPATLQGSLMARLDRLRHGKVVAQYGSVLGREFNFSLLESIAPVSGQELEEALESLHEAELLRARGVPPDANYSFKHALVHDTAYQSLLQRERRTIHAKAAEALQALSPEIAQSEPQVLARHYHRAGNGAEALEFYQRAATIAKTRFANEETISYLQNALEVLRTLPEATDRDEKELRLLISLSTPLSVANGWANETYGACLLAARDLAKKLGADKYFLNIETGLYFHHQFSGGLASAEECARKISELANPEMGDANYLLALSGLSQTLYLQGHVQQALDYLEKMFRRYRDGKPNAEIEEVQKDFATSTETPNPRVAYGLDLVLPADRGAASALRGIVALCRWATGYPDEALSLCKATLEAAHTQDSLFNLASAYIYLGWIHQKRRELPEGLNAAICARDICIEHGFSWLAWAKVLCGSMRVDIDKPNSEDADSAVNEIADGIASLCSAGTRGWLPHCYTVQADVFLKLQQPDNALQAIEYGLSCAQDTGQRYEDSELFRLRGEILTQGDGNDLIAAERDLRSAINIAQDEHALTLELRAATSFARLLVKIDRVSEAREILAPIHNSLSEGFKTYDWQDADALLTTLN